MYFYREIGAIDSFFLSFVDSPRACAKKKKTSFDKRKENYRVASYIPVGDEFEMGGSEERQLPRACEQQCYTSRRV